MDKLDDSIVNHHKFRSVWLKAYTMYLDTIGHTKLSRP